MTAKLVRTSRDGINWNILAGNDASIDLDGEELENTIFGSDFNSSITGIISHALSGNAMFRNTAGFEARLKTVSGNPTTFTTEALALNGDWYVIADRSKSLWDREEEVIFADAEGTIDPDDIAQVDYLNGRVRFVSGFTPDGAVTASGDFLTTAEFACARSIDLTQSLDTIETGCFESIGSNGGFELYKGTLRTVSADIEGFYRSTNDFYQTLLDREEILIEIDMDGKGTSVARGYFRVISDGLSGGVGGDETESVSFTLSVPEGFVPFAWYFASNSEAPASVQDIFWAWENKEELYVQYYPEGINSRGFQGQYIVTDASISTAVDAIGEVTVSGQGTGAISPINVS